MEEKALLEDFMFILCTPFNVSTSKLRNNLSLTYLEYQIKKVVSKWTACVMRDHSIDCEEAIILSFTLILKSSHKTKTTECFSYSHARRETT